MDILEIPELIMGISLNKSIGYVHYTNITIFRLELKMLHSEYISCIYIEQI